MGLYGDRLVILTILGIAVPKEHTVFRFTVPLPKPSASADQKESAEESKSLIFELHGSQFENKPVDRANKKFKWRNIDYV